MWDPVPWLVGGGAEHSPEISRLLTYLALGGAEGIVRASDLKVSALGTPGAAVQVAPGACAIVNKAATGGALQAYAARMVSTDTVAVAATGAGSGRSDLVVARIEDPFVAGTGYQLPADVKTGPYVFTRVISGVPAGTTTPPASAGSCIALARLDLPANTAVITNAMITDLRKVARPRRDRSVKAILPASTIPMNTNTFTTMGSLPWQVPSWATRAVIVATCSGLRAAVAAAAGELVAKLGTATTQVTIWDENGTANATRTTYMIASEVDVTALAGTVATLAVQGRRTSGTGTLQADTGSTITIDIEFSEQAA